jgi:hypothetical protein
MSPHRIQSIEIDQIVVNDGPRPMDDEAVAALERSE